MLKKRNHYLRIIFAAVLIFLIGVPASFADADTPFLDFPEKISIELTSLDTSGNLVYAGVDLAVFQDEDKDGIFAVMPGKVIREFTNSTSIAIDLGSASEYKKNCIYKLFMRILYVPVGTGYDMGMGDIVIADQGNGSDGWVEIPGASFRPAYFIDQDGASVIRHTDKWEENRQKYNLGKIAAGQDALVRPYGTFWSGEKFMIDIQTTEEVPSVRVSIKDSSYSATLTASTVTTGGAVYRGELWNKDMLNKWGNYIPKELTFTVDAMDDSGAVLETFKTTILIDNRDLYYQVKKAY